MTRIPMNGLALTLRRTEGPDAIGDRRVFEVTRVLSQRELDTIIPLDYVLLAEYREAERLLRAEMQEQRFEG